MSQIVDLTESVLFDSKSLYNEMALLRPNAIKKATTGFQWLHDNKIRGVLIGGMAVAHWSQDRTLTPDVDFLTDEFDKVVQLLNTQKIPYEQLGGQKHLYSGIHVPSLDLDFLDAEGGNTALNHHIMKTATLQRIGGVSFYVADPHVLSIAKMWKARNKDMEDSFNLLKSGSVNKDTLKQHLLSLKPAIKDDVSGKEFMGYANHLIPQQ